MRTDFRKNINLKKIKKVEIKVNALTHSYTIMLIDIPLFMCLQKSGDKFLNKSCFQAANIFATEHTSAVMTKHHMIVWF